MSALTTGPMKPTETNGPPAEVSTQWWKKNLDIWFHPRFFWWDPCCLSF